jgi:hypothetical protein
MDSGAQASVVASSREREHLSADDQRGLLALASSLQRLRADARERRQIRHAI